jgi:hypothetical protein
MRVVVLEGAKRLILHVISESDVEAPGTSEPPRGATTTAEELRKRIALLVHVLGLLAGLEDRQPQARWH